MGTGSTPKRSTGKPGLRTGLGFSLCYTVGMPTIAQFLAAYPEFRTTYERVPGMVENALEIGALHTGLEAFGSAYAQGVMMYAAHTLALSPYGEALRIQSTEGPTSVYFQRWKNLADSRRPRVMVGGGIPWGLGWPGCGWPGGGIF